MNRRALGIAIIAASFLAPAALLAQSARYNLLTFEGRARCESDCMRNWCQRERQMHKRCDPYEPNEICQKRCVCFGSGCARPR
jgi:hypothetical protein